jgi:hypothetical protein
LNFCVIFTTFAKIKMDYRLAPIEALALQKRKAGTALTETTQTIRF